MQPAVEPGGACLIELRETRPGEIGSAPTRKRPNGDPNLSLAFTSTESLRELILSAIEAHNYAAPDAPLLLIRPLVRFGGECAWDAVVNHNGLDLEEEDAFSRWLTELGLISLPESRDAAQAQFLHVLYHGWKQLNATAATPVP